MDTCNQCNQPFVESLLTHKHHIDQTDFNDVSQWYWLKRCPYNHYEKSKDSVSIEQIDYYKKFTSQGKKP